jgi:hypothetical protein
VKERHWNSLVTSLRHGQSVLVLGPELAVDVAAEGQATKSTSVIEALTRELASELEDDNRRVTGTTLSAVAQQYEDADGFGPNALKASAERFYKLRCYSVSDVHKLLAALPFSLVLTTCHDMLLTRALVDAGKKPIVQRYHLRGDKRPCGASRNQTASRLSSSISAVRASKSKTRTSARFWLTWRNGWRPMAASLNKPRRSAPGLVFSSAMPEKITN